MNMPVLRGSCRAFAVWDLAAVVVVLFFVAALLSVGAKENRRVARLGECLGNLRQYGYATASYGGDCTDLVWTFSWRAGQMNSQYPDLNHAATDLEAAANQAVDILRRRGGRVDITPITSWIPHLLYGHLVLEDYLGLDVPGRAFICPEDKTRVQWAADPRGYDACQYNPNPDCASNTGKRWPYSSTYELQPSFYSPDGGPTAVYQGPTHFMYFLPAGAVFGGRILSEVAFPSQKAMVYEQHGRHDRPRTPFFASEEARASMLAVDGSVGVRVTSETNVGWQPNLPTNHSPTIITYQPAAWEPPTLTGAPSQLVTGHFRWTRRGLAGRDFGGPQTP
jgi:hypothetical protein